MIASSGNPSGFGIDVAAGNQIYAPNPYRMKVYNSTLPELRVAILRSVPIGNVKAKPRALLMIVLPPDKKPDGGRQWQAE